MKILITATLDKLFRGRLPERLRMCYTISSRHQWTHHSRHMGASIVMGIPQARWMVYFRENPFNQQMDDKNRDTPMTQETSKNIDMETIFGEWNIIFWRFPMKHLYKCNPWIPMKHHIFQGMSVTGKSINILNPSRRSAKDHGVQLKKKR